MRAARFRFNIIGIMGAVAFTALALACIVEIRRIRRTQFFYRQEAARYARLEKAENAERSFYAAIALRTKEWAEYQLTRIQAGFAEDRFNPLYAKHQAVELRNSYYETMESGKKAYNLSVRARIDAERYSEAKQEYQRAADCLWLPFAPGPLGGKKGKAKK